MFTDLCQAIKKVFKHFCIYNNVQTELKIHSYCSVQNNPKYQDMVIDRYVDDILNKHRVSNINCTFSRERRLLGVTK